MKPALTGLGDPKRETAVIEAGDEIVRVELVQLQRQNLPFMHAIEDGSLRSAGETRIVDAIGIYQAVRQYGVVMDAGAAVTFARQVAAVDPFLIGVFAPALDMVQRGQR